MSSYKNKNTKIYYEIYSQGNHSGTLILIHDNGQSSRIFDSEIKFYSSYFRTITVDLSGHGKSPATKDSENNFWVNNAIAISEMCMKNKINKVSVIGLGGGGLVAMNMSLLFPDLVKGIMAESFPGIEPDMNYVNSIVHYRDRAKTSDAGSIFQSMNGSGWKKILDADTAMLESFIEDGGSYFHDDPGKINCPVLLAGSAVYDLVPDMETRLKDSVSSFRRAQVHLFSSGKYPLIITKNHEFRTVSLNYLMD
jgi:pimeloyl-ACP methyl ester carboxylesterase